MTNPFVQEIQRRQTNPFAAELSKRAGQSEDIGTTGTPRGRLPKGEQIGQGFQSIQAPTPEELGAKYKSVGISAAAGVADPILGGAQLVTRGLQAIAPQGTDLAAFAERRRNRVDSMITALDRQTAQARANAGYTGTDVPRLLGNVVATVPMMAAIPPGLGAGYRILSATAQGGMAAALQPVDPKASDYWRLKAIQTGKGLATGAATATLGVLYRRLRQGKITKPPSTEELRALSQQAYEEAKAAGVKISQSSWDAASNDFLNTMKTAGFHPGLHPRMDVVLKELQNMKGSSPTLEEADQFRRLIQSAGKSIEPDERRLAGVLIDKLDSYIEKLGPGQIAAGDKAGIAALGRGRMLWARYRKGQTIDELVDRAATRAGQFSGSGFENALRTEFRGFAMNARKMRGFSPDEQQAIKAVAKGGPIGNVLRLMGKLAPTSVVSAALGGGLGYAAGQGPGVAAAYAIGAVGRKGAEFATKQAANAAGNLVRGGAKAVPQQLTPAGEAILRAINAGTTRALAGE